MSWSAARSRVLPLLALIFAATAGCGGAASEAKSPASEGAAAGQGRSGPAEVGKPAPDLTIQTLNGKGRVSIESLAGKVAVIDFWATWCGPCKKSFPKLEELSKRYGGAKVEVIGIAVDDSVDGVGDFAKSNGATFPIGWDDGHSIAERWKVSSMPTTYILDATGTVRFIHAGFHDGEPEAIAKEVASLQDGTNTTSGTTRVAAAAPAPSDAPPPPSKSAAGEPDAAAIASAATADAPEPPPKKKPGKAGKGKGSGKGGKKHGKKPAAKKPAAPNNP